MPPSRDPLFTPRFAMLWVYAFVTFFSAFQLLPAIPFRILDLGGSKGQAGWFLCVYTYASAFAAPLMGSLADRVTSRENHSKKRQSEHPVSELAHLLHGTSPLHSGWRANADALCP